MEGERKLTTAIITFGNVAFATLSRYLSHSQITFVHNVTRTPSAGVLGIGDDAVLTVHFTRKVWW